PLLFAMAEDVFLGVESVVDERIAAVPPGVIAREKNPIGWQWRSRLPVAVQRLDEGQAFSSLLQGKMGVQDIGIVWKEGCEVGAAVFQSARRNFDDARGRCQFGARLCEHCDPMAVRGQSFDQRNDDALRSAIAFDRQPVM